MVLHASAVEAQTPPFVYRSTTGTWNVQAFALDTTPITAPPEISQFTRDPFGNVNVIVHEFGHALLGHDDEYVYSATQPQVCSHTWMGPFTDNQFTFCTAETHRQTALNWDTSRSQQGPINIQGGVSFSHGDARSDWVKMSDDSILAVPFPSNQTPEVLRMAPFWGSDVIGRFDRLQ